MNYGRESFHNAVIETETGICTSLKSDLYFQSHLPLSTKTALPNFNSVRNLVIVEKCGDQSPKPQKSESVHL